MNESFDPYADFEAGHLSESTDLYPVGHYTEKWLTLYKKALTLSPKRFERFMFGVGLFGTDEERCHKGEAIWEMMHPKTQPDIFYELRQIERKGEQPK